jgi:hypothetical protein
MAWANHGVPTGASALHFLPQFLRHFLHPEAALEVAGHPVTGRPAAHVQPKGMERRPERPFDAVASRPLPRDAGQPPPLPNDRPAGPGRARAVYRELRLECPGSASQKITLYTPQPLPICVNEPKKPPAQFPR